MFVIPDVIGHIKGNELEALRDKHDEIRIDHMLNIAQTPPAEKLHGCDEYRTKVVLENSSIVVTSSPI